MEGFNHPDPQQQAKYLDHGCTPEERAVIEEHCAECAECRVELVEAWLAIRTAPWVPSSRRPHHFVPLAAAAILAIVLLPRGYQRAVAIHREPGVETTLAPVPAVPTGDVSTLAALTWTRVAGAEAYQPAVYDSAGAVLWTIVTTDTSVVVPASLPVVPARDYYWTVRARFGWGRSASSPLTRFRLARSSAAPR